MREVRGRMVVAGGSGGTIITQRITVYHYPLDGRLTPEIGPKNCYDLMKLSDLCLYL